MRLLAAVLALSVLGCADKSAGGADTGRISRKAVVDRSLPPLPSDPAAIPKYVGDNGLFNRPKGSGPFPAVIIMHGCSGPPSHTEWVKRLNGWGYASYYIDSFTPRGLGNICDHHPQEVRSWQRAPDAYAALAYLRTRPDVRPDKIALIGFSHGGGAAAQAAHASSLPEGVAPFAAAVAYYGGCGGPEKTFELANDLLILMGMADDWANPENCPKMVARQSQPTKDRLTLVMYPDAVHGFDVGPHPPIMRYGHRLEYNEPAAHDSFQRVKGFLDQRVGR